MKAAARNAMKATLALATIFGLSFVPNGSALAWGHGPHVRFGVVIGGPLWWGPGYYPPYAYYPPPSYYAPAYYPWAPAAPSVYIEQGAVRPAPAIRSAPPQASYWYYCAESKGYYPYVKSCPGGWQRVSPRPPG